MAGNSAPMAPEDRFVSYAQTCEDVILNRIFRHVNDGFYIDIGAYHPVIGSVTKAFYDRGWCGINVEPASIFEELRRARPRDINVKAAVLDREATVEFLEDRADRGMSRVGAAAGELNEDRLESYQVQAITLNDLVARHAQGREISFLKIDAEGAEAAIILATNWKNVRPMVILVEATAPWTNNLVNDEWEPALLANGFIRAYFDGINVFYLRVEDAALLCHFKCPVNVLDNYETHALVETQRNIERVESEKSALRDDLESRISNLSEVIQQQNADLAATRVNAERYARLVNELDVDVGPRALKMVLPLARLIRTISHPIVSRAGADTGPQVANVPTAAPVGPSVATAAGPAQPKAPRRSLLKRFVLGIYRVTLRPVVRPLLFRLRTFMLMPLLDHLNHSVAVFEHPANRTSHANNVGQAQSAEYAQVLKSIETLLLTIASNRKN